MELLTTILIAAGIPSTLVGLFVWFFKKKIEENEKKREEHEKNLESLVLMMLQSTRANSILGVATAEAVRDGHCNGNMTAALATVEKVASAEKEFLLEKSIKYIFE
jgi:hypothetical protein